VCAGALDALPAPDSADHQQALARIDAELSKLLKDYSECFR
jgi:hypothetical protein